MSSNCAEFGDGGFLRGESNEVWRRFCLCRVVVFLALDF